MNNEPEHGFEPKSGIVPELKVSEGNHEVKVKVIEKPAPYSKKEMGKLRRQFITQVSQTVIACGHKFHPTDEPRTHCHDCWEAFFRTHEAMVKGVQATIAAFGIEQLVKARGKGFVSEYKKFALKVEEEQRNVTLV